MLRTTLCTLAALILSAGVLGAAESKGRKVDKPFPATIVKMDVAKHVLILKTKCSAGKELTRSVPIAVGSKLPKAKPGSTFLVFEKGGKVTALKPIPSQAAGTKTVAAERMAKAKAYLAKANKAKVIAQKAEKASAIALKTATARLNKAKAIAAKTVKAKKQAFQSVKAKIKAARVAQRQLIQARFAVAKAYKAKVLAVRNEKIKEAVAKVAAKRMSMAKAAFAKTNHHKVAVKKSKKGVTH